MSFSGMVFMMLLGLIIFGPKKLSHVGKLIGRVIAELKSFSRDFKSQLEIEMGARQQERIGPASSSQSQLPTDTGLRFLETDGFGSEHGRVEAFHG
jgi:Sec-independent protein translocase protein TatA